MDFALQAALLGAVMGSAVLAVSTIYGWTLPASPPAYGWWAAAFVLEAASKGVLLSAGAPGFTDLSDLLHGLSTGLSLCGAISFLGGRVTAPLMVFGLLASLVWAVLVHMVRAPLGLTGLPVFGIGGVPLLMAAWGFLGQDRKKPGDGVNRLAALSFAASGLHQLAAPLLHAHPTTATWSFIVSQLLSMVMAVALLFVVVRRQQAMVESEGQRANLLHSRLVDALGGVHDAVALFDGDDRLITCNALYREFLAPASDAIRPGRLFADIVRAGLAHGAVPDAVGREEQWTTEALKNHARADGSPREFQMWDGRWVSVSVYRTADGGHLRILRDVTNSKQAETALKDSLTWLRGIMDTVVDGIISVDETGTVLSFNRSAERIFGYDVIDVVGRDVSMLLPEGSPDFQVAAGSQILGRRLDGSLFPMELTVTQMRQGDLVTYIGVVRDITDRKKVENALVESEQRFRDLAESASDWFWELDSELVFTFVSGRVRQALGVGPSFFIGRPFGDFGRSTERAAEWDAQQERMRMRQPFRGFIFLHTAPSGEVKYVEVAGRPAFDSQDNFCGYRGTATDITPLKRHERELAVQSRLRQAIIDNMGQGMAVFDRNEQLMALNHRARIQLDLPGSGGEQSTETLEAMLIYLGRQGEFGDGDIGVKVARRLGRLRRKPNQTFEHSRPGGLVLEVRSTAMPGGGLIFTFTDITDRKKAEDTLREAKDAAERGNRAKATFLANISHELRTPLNAIIGFSELMKHEIFGPLEPQSYRGYIDDIHESGMHLLELINDILDMSKAEAGMTDLVDSMVDVAGLVRSCLRMMARRAGTCGVVLQDVLPENLPSLRADERRLRQIVLNLVSNAVKFTDEGGTVTVTAEADGTGFRLTVADTGIGMTPEDLERVMEPFVQADTRLSRKYEGTGLGLPLTKALITAHGGTMRLASAPGVGTTVTAVFPSERIIVGIDKNTTAEEASRRG